MASRPCFPNQNDSMAVYLAGVLGVLSLAIFGKQNPVLTKPKFKKSTYIPPKYPCNHKNNHWRLCGECTNTVTPESVFDEINRLLSCFSSKHD